jgi:hypothetical protein
MADMEYCKNCKNAVVEWPKCDDWMLEDVIFAEFLCGKCGEDFDLVLALKDKDK